MEPSMKVVASRGLRPGSDHGGAIDERLLPWDDRATSKASVLGERWGAGWRVLGLDGVTRWFSVKTWGSWRLAFLLARLQGAVWRENPHACADQKAKRCSRARTCKQKREESDAAFTLDGAKVDEKGRLVSSEYQAYVPRFNEVQPLSSVVAVKGSRPGVRFGEKVEATLTLWDDRTSGRNGERWGAGWRVRHSSGAARYFNIKVWGSWRLAYLLARLQDEVWRKRKHKVAATKRSVSSASIPQAPRAPDVLCKGPLQDHIAQTEFARKVLGELESTGFTVLQGVLKPSEADAALARMWEFVETVSPTVRRGEPDSWYHSHGKGDPWPHTSRDFMQLHQAGWVFGDLRVTLAQRLFEPLYGSRELHTSKDGFCFQRPTPRPVRRRAIDHFDQGSGKLGLHCIQASVALLDQELDDGCFLCWPGSHKLHPSIVGSSPGGRDWYKLSDADKASLTAAGIAPRRVPVRRGDVVLWRSDLAHSGADPVGVRQGFRAVVYVCMLPGSFTPDAIYSKKQQAYELLKTGSHWPNREDWFYSRGFLNNCIKSQPFFRSPPPLDERLRQLYGLQRYSSSSAE